MLIKDFCLVFESGQGTRYWSMILIFLDQHCDGVEMLNGMGVQGQIQILIRKNYINVKIQNIIFLI
jgi:hypothetical protein